MGDNNTAGDEITSLLIKAKQEVTLKGINSKKDEHESGSLSGRWMCCSLAPLSVFCLSGMDPENVIKSQGHYEKGK